MILSVCSLFVGVLDIRPSDLFTGSVETWEIFLISRLPRLLAILCTGIGMSVAGLIMQQLPQRSQLRHPAQHRAQGQDPVDGQRCGR